MMVKNSNLLSMKNLSKQNTCMNLKPLLLGFNEKTAGGAQCAPPSVIGLIIYI